MQTVAQRIALDEKPKEPGFEEEDYAEPSAPGAPKPPRDPSHNNKDGIKRVLFW